MASLTQGQQKAWLSAYEKAQSLGLTDEQASNAASKWASRTDFGETPRATFSAGKAKRSHEPSSNIEQLFATAVEAVDPTYEGVVGSGQEPPIGLEKLTAGQRREHRGYMDQGFDSETASRIVNREGAKYRHPLGVAVDARVNTIADNKVTDRDITDQVAFNFVQATGGNVGRGGYVGLDQKGKPIYYMSKGTNHYDTAKLRDSHMRQFWGSLDKGFLQEMQQANALHDLGVTDQSMLPTPTGRGVSRSNHVVNALAASSEPAFQNQFAPGGGGLLGAPQIAPTGSIGQQPTRSDFPTGPLNPRPWQDQYAPAAQYASRTASPARFDKAFALPAPRAPPLTPGTSNTAKAAAYRGLGDSMQQAGVGGLDGRAATQSQAGIDRYGPVNAEHSPSIPPVPSHRPPVPVPFTPPIPKARPQSVAPPPTARPSAPPHSNVPLPTPRPSTYSAVPMAPPHRTQMHQQPSPYTGPKKQIFDFVLRQLLEPAPGPK